MGHCNVCNPQFLSHSKALTKRFRRGLLSNFRYMHRYILHIMQGHTKELKCHFILFVVKGNNLRDINICPPHPKKLHINKSTSVITKSRRVIQCIEYAAQCYQSHTKGYYCLIQRSDGKYKKTQRLRHKESVIVKIQS